MKVNFGLIQEMVVLGFGSDKNQHLNEGHNGVDHLLKYGSYSPCLLAMQIQALRQEKARPFVIMAVVALTISLAVMLLTKQGVWFWVAAFYTLAAVSLLVNLSKNTLFSAD